MRWDGRPDNESGRGRGRPRTPSEVDFAVLIGQSGLHRSKYVTPTDVVDTWRHGDDVEHRGRLHGTPLDAPAQRAAPHRLLGRRAGLRRSAGAVVVTRAGWPTALSVLVGGVGVAVSWRYPWTGLVITSGASFAVSAAGRDPLPVWMLAVLVLFSCTLRGLQPLAATALVAGVLLASFMTVGGFRGGAAAGAAAVFSAVAGGATGAALRSYRAHWWTLAERARAAIAHPRGRSDPPGDRGTPAHRPGPPRRHRPPGRDAERAPRGRRGRASRRRRILAAGPRGGPVLCPHGHRRDSADPRALRRGEDAVDDEALRPTPALSGLDL